MGLWGRCAGSAGAVGLVLAALAAASLGCNPDGAPVETAIRLTIDVDPTILVPDELRLSAYDDQGSIFSNRRLPERGALIPERFPRLGTVTVHVEHAVGEIRIQVRGLAGGALVCDGTLRVQPADGRVVDVPLVLPAGAREDRDGDGVADDIDDCPDHMDSQQTGGCTAGPDADAGSRADRGTDESHVDTDGSAHDHPAGVETGQADDAADSGDAWGHDDAEPDCDGPCRRDNGEACSGRGQCVSGFCVDGVCCGDACSGTCVRCNLMPGVCTFSRAGSDPDGECGDTWCSGSAAACATSCAGSSCSDGCKATAHCKAGQCVPNGSSGAACDRSCDCASGKCVGGRCR